TEITDAAGNRIGRVTSGGFGPSVGGPVAMGYVDRAHAAEGTALELLVRGTPRPARVARVPFVPTHYYPGWYPKGNPMSLLRFTKAHEWIRLDGDLAVVGITNYAQSQLGDVVYVELPEIGRRVEKGKEAAVVESVKAASEVYAPASGEVAEVNEAITADPAKVN